MTIVHVISGLGVGGAERNLVQMVHALQSRLPQHVVSVGNRGVFAEEIEAGGIPVTALGIESMFGAPAGIVRLTRLIEELRANIIQGWMYHGNLLAALAHLCARGRSGRHLLWNLRASNVQEPKHQRLLRWTAYISHWPDIIIANSHAGARFHLENGYRPRRLEVIHNGIDTERFRPDPSARAAIRSELGIPETSILAIHVARVDPMKDHATLLAVIAATPQIDWLLVGAGTERLPLPTSSRALGMRRDVERLYACADIVVSTSAFAEGFSNVIAEGMSAGLVPIATDVGDASVIVGDTGHIVPPGDVTALVRAVGAEAASPSELRMARGLKARTRIVNHFGLSRAFDNFARLYQSLGQHTRAA